MAQAKPSPPNVDRTWLFAGLSTLAVLLFIRNPYVVMQPQFWHEDAIVFLAQQRTEGAAAIFHPYSGYLLLFPRLVAAGAALLPLEFTPRIYLVGTYIGWLWVGGLIFTSSLFASRKWAFFAGLAWVAVPHGGEVFLVLTNIQWALAVGLVLLLAEGSITPRGKTSQLLFVTLASLTGPFCILLSPLALWRLWLQRSRGTADVVAILVLSGALIQFLSMLCSSNRLHDSTTFDAPRLSLVLWIAVFPELFGTKGAMLGDIKLRLAGTLVGSAGALWSMWIAIPGARDRRKLLLAASLILGSSLAYMIATFGGAPLAFGQGQRYLFVPFALYVLALISAWSHCRNENRTWIFAFLLLAIIGLHSSTHFVAAQYQAADWSTVTKLLRSGQTVEIRVAPMDTPVMIRPKGISGVQPNP